MASTNTYPPNRVFMGPDGDLYLNNGAVYSSGGVNIAPFLAKVAQTTAAGVILTGSTGILTTGNPTTIGTGLGTVKAFGVMLRSTAAPTTAVPTIFSYEFSSSGGEVKLYGWKGTATAGEYVAHTSSAEYTWFALGTS